MVGVAGGSYGGAVALLAAGHDQRVDAIAPAITYWNLSDALFPNGVFKKLWAGLFVNLGGGCDQFEDQLCRMYQAGRRGPGSRTRRPWNSSTDAARRPSATASTCPRC